MTTRGGAAEQHAIGARLAMGRLIARMDVDFVKAHEAPTAGSLHVIAGTTRRVKARVMGVAPRKAEMIGATLDAAAVAAVGLRDPVEQERPAVARVRPVKISRTTIALVGVVPRPPTAQCAHARRRAKTPGRRLNNADDARQVRAASGKMRRDQGVRALVAAIRVDACRVAMTRVILARGGQARRRRRNLAASRLAHHSA